MTANALAQSPDTDIAKPGLIFDADSVTLLGKFTNEFSAHRAKREWMGTFAHHFLLERSRDYQTEIGKIESTEFYYLRCTFESACGRYAFWRLVNHQASEVEKKLISPNLVNKKVGRFLLGSVWNVSSGTPWILSSPGRADKRSNTGILKSVIESIQRALRA